MDVDRYRKSVCELDWSDLYDSNDINELNNIFEKKLFSIL